jgi:eukaryotic-like serine/threonine-protein kinase
MFQRVQIAACALVIVFCLAGCPLSVTVPNVVGMTQTAAGIYLAGNGLLVGDVTPTFSDTVTLGVVISQNPVAASSAREGDAVDW